MMVDMLLNKETKIFIQVIVLQNILSVLLISWSMLSLVWHKTIVFWVHSGNRTHQQWSISRARQPTYHARRLLIYLYLYTISTPNHTVILIKFSDDSLDQQLMANELVCDIVVSEFELQSRYYVHFRTNILGEGMSPPPSFQLMISSLFFCKDAFGIK